MAMFFDVMGEGPGNATTQPEPFQSLVPQSNRLAAERGRAEHFLGRQRPGCIALTTQALDLGHHACP